MKIKTKKGAINYKEEVGKKILKWGNEKIVPSANEERTRKRMKKIIEQKAIDRSPCHFSSSQVPLVPLFMINILEWLLHHKPVSLIKEKHGHFHNKSSFIKEMRKDVYNFKELQRVLYKWLDGHSGVFDEYKIKNKNSGFETSISNKWMNKNEVKKFSVKIEESPTFTLFYQSKKCAIPGTHTAKLYERENENYLNNIKRCKKMFSINSQTPLSFKESKCSETFKSPLSNKNIFCTICEDSENLSLKTKSEIADNNNLRIPSETFYVDPLETRYMELSISVDSSDFQKSKGDLDEDDDEFSEAKRMVDIIQSEEFFRISLLIGRVLERNSFESNQTFLKMAIDRDLERSDVKFKYSITYLRTARYLKVWGLPVTSISVNPINKNLFAVSHGQYFNDQPDNLGRVNLWNHKNLSIPEKTIDFKSGVASVEFSSSYPYALLVAFIKGYISILDVAKRTPIIIVTNKSDCMSDHLWQAYWFKNDIGNDIAVSCGSGGIVYWYHSKNFQKNQLVSLLGNEGSMRGIEIPKSSKHFSASSEQPNIYCLAPHPTNHLTYLAGTDDGCVHVCSTDCWNKHLESMQAHHGPVHHIKYHPHTPMVFLTVGIDYCVRIWAPTIYEPLITINYFENYVEDAEWSPEHPTILVTISGCYLNVWDIRRIALEPCSTFKSPTDSRFTTVKFLSGNTLICGDIHGDVHILGLQDLPFIPICKATALAKSIKRVLLGNFDVLDQLRKLGSPFDEYDEDDQKVILA